MLSATAIPAVASPLILADVDVRVDLGAPPPPRHEVVVERERPGPDYVWTEGYWGGSPGHYTLGGPAAGIVRRMATSTPAGSPRIGSAMPTATTSRSRVSGAKPLRRL